MRARLRLVLCCGAAAATLSAVTALADQQIGNVVQREFNGATGVRVATSGADDLIFERDVFAGETVRTPGAGSTVIRFQDKTQIQLGAGSTVVLDKFVYDPSTSTGDAAIKFGTGVFRFITGNIKNKDAVKLSTPTTSLTIRGTKFILAVALDGATILGVLEGAVDVTPCGSTAPVRENTGQAVRVDQTCRASQVSLGSVPTDFATIADYDVSENRSGNNPGLGGTEGRASGDSSHTSGNDGGAPGGGSGGGGTPGGRSGGGGTPGGGGGGFGGGGGHTDH
jgi:hypothetical protein